MASEPVLIAVTDHAEERWRQRIGGSLDARPEIMRRVGEAWAAGSISSEPPAGAAGQRGSVYVTDLQDRGLVYACLHDRPRAELIVISLWESGPGARVPRQFTDALRERRPRRE